MATVTIQYWAAAREAAGVELESVDAGTLAEALDVVLARRGTTAACAGYWPRPPSWSTARPPAVPRRPA